mmetsp:Transcript_52897/g.114897  ORF Transcript_52897/g.114897 Transcript_52897/m.114897 type:complete len:88 (+) Transcript_52897:639-902(+)
MTCDPDWCPVKKQQLGQVAGHDECAVDRESFRFPSQLDITDEVAALRADHAPSTASRDQSTPKFKQRRRDLKKLKSREKVARRTGDT